MNESYHVTVVARLSIPVETNDIETAKRMAVQQAKTRHPGLPWTAEEVDIPWGT